jgi:hypothetical protein
MVLALGFAVLFALGGVYNWLHGDWQNALAGFVIAGFLCGMWRTAARGAEATAELERWLIDHEPEIFAGGARFGQVLITPHTRIRRMKVCLSVLILTTWAPTGPVIEGRDSVFAAAFTASVFTFLFGWWGFPWGPIRTLDALICNLRGGETTDVSTWLAQKMGGRAEPAA